MKKYKVGARVFGKWIEETIEAKYPQEAIDSFRKNHPCGVENVTLYVKHEWIAGIFI